jgi:SSS family solute:Na+ symporter
MNIALILIFGTMLLALWLGVRAQRGKDMSLEQWTVAGRGFGAGLVFLLMAGEIYTTFVFLGGSGFAYGVGGPAYYMLGFGSLSFVLSYWILPPIWRFAKQHRLLSQPDFFAKKFNSPALGIVVALVGVVALMPYLVLQLKGLGIIVSVASYSGLSSTQGVWIGAIVTVIYVMVSGVHGSAWTSVLKDFLVLAVAIFLGLYLPWHYYGGITPMFEAIELAKPGFLALPATGKSAVWMTSTVLLTTLGFYMWPHMFMASFTAKSEQSLRRNAYTLPIYQMMLLFVFFVGFAAVLQIPGLTGPDIDLALFKISIATFDPWVVGIIGAAGVLTAIVPGSMILMAVSTLLANNVYRAIRKSSDNAEADNRHIGRVAKLAAPLVMLVGLWFTLQGGQTIVSLLLMAYSLVTQLFPALLASIMPSRPVSKVGAIVGILVGEATVAILSVTKMTISDLIPFIPDFLKDTNVGVVALTLNVIAMLLVTAVTRSGAKQDRRQLQADSIA